MGLVLLTVQQMVVMLLYLLAGFCLFRAGVITDAGSKDLAGMLVKFVIPAVVINSFCIPFSAASLLALGQSTLLAAVLLALSIALAHGMYRRTPLENIGAAFSNAGFMGIPLGLVLFVSGLGGTLPAPVAATLQGISGLNGPLAMMVLGVYLARENPAALFAARRLYGVSAVRLLLIPAASLLVLWLLPAPRTPALALLLCAAAPVGANVAVYAQLHGKDYAYASKMVVLSTVLSMLSLPLVTAAGTALL